MTKATELLTTTYISINAEDHLTTLIGKLKTRKENLAVVIDKGVYIGMIDKHKWIKIRLDASEAKVKHYITKAPQLHPDTELEEIARLMYTADIHTLPVIEHNHIIGVVCAHDVIKAAEKYLNTTRLDEVSTTTLITTNTSDSISKVINTLRTHHIDRLPVIDTKGKLAGIVTSIDILEKYFCFPPVRQGSTGRRGAAAAPTKEIHTAKITIENEMTRDVITVGLNQPIKKVVELFTTNHISSVIITDAKENPCGIITIKDLLGAITKK